MSAGMGGDHRGARAGRADEGARHKGIVMSANTRIEWTDATWNPVTGCTRISPGCQHCYAERLTATRLAHQERYRGLAVMQKGEARWSNEVRLHHDVLTEPLRWHKPRMVFTCSMSDLFHEGVALEFIDQVFAIMLGCAVLSNRRQTFQVLSKRAWRMRRYFEQTRNGVAHLRRWAALGNGLITMDDEDTCFDEHVRACGEDGAKPLYPLPNVWLGVSVEDRHCLDRIQELRATPAAVRWVSFEPLLEDVGDVDLCGIDWAVIGGETGSEARPFMLSWARRLVNQARRCGCAVFVKQFGSCPHDGTAEQPNRLHLFDRRGLDLSEWPKDLQIQEWPR